MTEEQKKAIIESGKEYFRTVIIPNHVGKMGTFLSTSNLADIMGVSLATVQKWYESGTYPARTNERERKGFSMEDLAMLPPVRAMLHSKWAEELHVTPARAFTSIELFAGGGGLALGMEKAGFKHVLLNEFDPYACQTLRTNRPEWNVVEGDVAGVDFTPWRDKVDFLSGGFPCQAFSYAGKKGGLNDTRGTLFFQLARAVKEVRPKVFMGENVKRLLSHDEGRTLDIIKNVVAELGYTLVEPRVLLHAARRGRATGLFRTRVGVSARLNTRRKYRIFFLSHSFARLDFYRNFAAAKKTRK